MKNKFTEGEWKSNSAIPTSIVVGDKPILDVWSFDRSEEETKANINLAKAAPELLKALQLVQYGYMQQTDYNDLSKEHKGIHNIVNNAINKALGDGEL